MAKRKAEEYKRVLLWIASQSKGCMASDVMHWFPTPPEPSAYPKDVAPFTAPSAEPRTWEFA